MENFTRLAQEALQKAQEIKDKNRDSELTSLHLLCGVLRAGFETLDAPLREAGINPIALSEDAENAIRKLPKVEGAGGEERVSPDLHKVLRGAPVIAKEMGDSFITVEHVLLSLVERSDMFELKSVLQKHALLRADNRLKSKDLIDSLLT